MWNVEFKPTNDQESIVIGLYAYFQGTEAINGNEYYAIFLYFKR